MYVCCFGCSSTTEIAMSSLWFLSASQRTAGDGSQRKIGMTLDVLGYPLAKKYAIFSISIAIFQNPAQCWSVCYTLVVLPFNAMGDTIREVWIRRKTSQYFSSTALVGKPTGKPDYPWNIELSCRFCLWPFEFFSIAVGSTAPNFSAEVPSSRKRFQLELGRNFAAPCGVWKKHTQKCGDWNQPNWKTPVAIVAIMAMAFWNIHHGCTW